MAQYGGSERAAPESYASGGTRITHNYTITHLDSFGKVAYIEWYETPYGRPFGLGGNQHIGTYYPKLDEYEPTVNGYPDADAFGSSEIGKSKIITAAKESSRDAIRELKTNNNTSGLTPSQIATETNQTVTSMFNYNSTTETINPNENNATQPGDSGTGSTETATQDDTTTGTATQDDTTTGTATQDEMTTPPVPSEGAAPIQNFAGTGDPDAGRDLRYPFDHTSAYDFIKIFPMRYIPAMQTGNMVGGIDSLRQNASSHFSQVGQRYQNAEKAGSMVFLPMIPAGETNSTGWGDQDRMNAIQKEFGIAASKIISGAFSQGEEWAAESLSSLKDAAAGLVLENSGLNQFITAHFAGKAVSANLLGRSGVAINPNLELLFSGPSLRNFTYNFTFTPRGRKETQEVRDIIKVFKKGMAPKRTEQHVFLNVPHVWNVEYVYNSRGLPGTWQHPYLNKIKPCALRSFTVDYMPGGNYMTYSDGSMTSYQVTMSFGELEPIYNNDIDMTSNDMGY